MNIEEIKNDLKSYFEIISYLQDSYKFNHTDLIPAMNETAIHSFGWPIGIVILGNEHKPIYTQDGISAKISTLEDGAFGQSFDFWSLKITGEFYLIKSLFEDRRGKGFIYFDVRIKRVAESLLRLGKLYKRLGCADDAIMGLKISYEGLLGRVLRPASPDFFLPFERKCSVSSFDFSFKATIGELNDKEYLSKKTIEICSGLFILFDGFVLDESLYKKVIDPFLAKAL